MVRRRRKDSGFPDGRDGDRKPRRLRCAIYTRKSSDEGLEQSFNSLHAQRDACEAYVASQKHEGWVLLPAAYDDGGLSGGSLERPALQSLLDDIRSGAIDIVVVYKVDRLTRSLADFARLTELFDLHGASFVSVTQQFNTSTSMGRLTLNVLLSFAQFEREVAGERIRDKIALSKRRGMWMGGLPPLGYDGIDRQLVVNAAEAATVRLIFERYLALGSIPELKRALDRDGIVSKRRVFADGRTAGGVPISRGALHQILHNRLYRGEIAHRGEVHQGNHEAILPQDLWDAVQAKLASQSQRPQGRPNNHREDGGANDRKDGGASHSRSSGSSYPGANASPSRPTALLAGIAFDEAGNRLTPSHTSKKGRRYHYYVSAPLVRGEATANGIRVPASDLDRLVVDAMDKHLGDAVWLSKHPGEGLVPAALGRLIEAAGALANGLTSNRDQTGDPRNSTVPGTTPHLSIRSLLDRVTVGRQRVVVSVNRSRLRDALKQFEPSLCLTDRGGEPISIEVDARPLRCGKQVRLVVGEIRSETPNHNRDLIDLLRNAHRWFEALKSGRRSSIAEIARRDGIDTAEVSRSITLAFLAPDIVETILAGRQPMTLTLERLRACRPLPMDWNEQRHLLLDQAQL
ncbi:MAG: recombinase family protein [Rhodobiaceae bacterium]|nr:recombinase family protein [Rhodobiaceae bacterium]